MKFENFLSSIYIVIKYIHFLPDTTVLEWKYSSNPHLRQSKVKGSKRSKWSYAHHIVEPSIPFQMKPKQV